MQLYQTMVQAENRYQNLIRLKTSGYPIYIYTLHLSFKCQGFKLNIIKSLYFAFVVFISITLPAHSDEKPLQKEEPYEKIYNGLVAGALIGGLFGLKEGLIPAEYIFGIETTSKLFLIELYSILIPIAIPLCLSHSFQIISYERFNCLENYLIIYITPTVGSLLKSVTGGVICGIIGGVSGGLISFISNKLSDCTQSIEQE